MYRCALMCSQFPMLSAPSPPEGHSPTPTPPTLPLRFHPPNIGSLTDGEMARTAPDEYLSAVMVSCRNILILITLLQYRNLVDERDQILK